MNPTNLTNGAADELFYPADYGAEIQLAVMRADDRQALRGWLRELLALPHEQWEEHGVIDMAPRQPGKYAVFFGEDGIAWVIPEPDGRFRVTGLGSQEKLEALRQHADAGEDRRMAGTMDEWNLT